MNRYLRPALLGLALAAGTARGGVSAEFSDQCAWPAYAPGQIMYYHTDALADGWMTWDVYREAGTTFFACTRRTLIIIASNLAGPATGSATAFTGSTAALRTYFRDHEAWLRPSAVINRSGLCYAAVTGTANPWSVAVCAGKPVERLYGWYLGDSTPAWVTWQVSSAVARGAPPGELLLPFRIASAGGGGWLSMAYKGQEFWRQPVSGFAAGPWYRATVPVALLNEADPVFTVHLESTGATAASVFIPSESMLSVDSDGDGVADGLDNCITAVNSTQRNTDGDGYGNACDADLNNSGGVVNNSDLAIFRAAFGTVNANADLNDSGGAVNFADLSRFRSLFGKAPGPSGLVP